MSEPVLLAIEADHAHRYAFETNDLREVRGACALMDRLNRLDTREIIEEAAGSDSVVVADGGLALAIVPGADAPEILLRVQQRYRAATQGVSVTGAWTPCSTDQEQSGFGDAIKSALAALRLAKQSSGSPIAIPGHPLFRVCTSCRTRPAEKQDDEGWLCRACAAKRQEHEREPATGPWMRLRWFAESAGDDVRMLRRVRPRTLVDIGDGVGSTGSVGLIYCDGNGVGQRLLSMSSRERVVRMADGVNDLLEDLTFRTMLEMVPIEVIDGAPCLPCEPLFVGGDDVILLAPASLAMPLAIQLLQRFERDSAERLSGEKLTMSAAVVLAPISFPLARQVAIAKDLLSSAKRRFQETGGTTSTLDYWVVPANLASTPSLLRDAMLRRVSKGDTLELTQRPLTVRRAEILWQDVRQLRALDVEPALIGSIAEGATRSRRDAIDVSRRVLAQCTTAQRTALSRALGNQQTGSDVPWRREGAQGDRVYSTGVLDLLELMPLVAEPSHAAT